MHHYVEQINRKKEMMEITLICVPTLDKRGLLADISVHFGKTPYFTFIKYDDGEIKDVNVIETHGKHKGGSKTPAEIILDSGADILICGNLGSKAVHMLRDSEIEVFSGASGIVKDTLSEWRRGNLKFADENSCDEKS
jgi:predicted Fe-Mo cluster-binding NifX family protein